MIDSKNNSNLIDRFPDLLAEWDYENNNANNIDVNTVTYGSHKLAAWKCIAYKHEYMMVVKERVNGQGCPFCANKKVLRGFNDFMSKYPEIVRNEWDWINNDADEIKPDCITAGTCRQVYFRCEDCKGSYKMAVNVKTAGNGCPYCSNHRVLTGFNDLQSCYPELVESEWN